MDAVLRELIRRARASGDPRDRARAIAAWLRSGGRDPREDPRREDVIVSQSFDGKWAWEVMVVADPAGLAPGRVRAVSRQIRGGNAVSFELPDADWQYLRIGTHSWLLERWRDFAAGTEVLAVGGVLPLT